MIKKFVTFFSPGTFMAEETTESIDEWDVNKAIEMSRNIKERYNAFPYGFQFTTRSRDDDELDSKVVAKSPFYWLGGEVLTLEQVKSHRNPDDEILISNMENNGYNKIIINTNSWKWTMPLEKTDIVLDFHL